MNTQPSYKKSIILCLMITTTFTGCTPSQHALPSLAGKPRLKINQNRPVSEQSTAVMAVDHNASGSSHSNGMMSAENSKAP